MTTNTTRFDPAFPFTVAHGHIVEGEDLRQFVSCCCAQAARDEAVTLRAKGKVNVEVIELRAIPSKGAGGGWRVAPSVSPHRCGRAPRIND